MPVAYTCSHCRVNRVPNAVSPFTVCQDCAATLASSEQRIYNQLVNSNALLAVCARTVAGVK